MADENDEPAWLYHDLVEDDLPWDQATQLTVKVFLERFTLHDSGWVGIFHNVAFHDTVTLCVRWDLVWLPSDVGPPRVRAADWPYLLIKVVGANVVSTQHYDGDTYGCSRTIADAEVTEIDGRQTLIISDVFGGNVTIVFVGDVYFLMLDRARRVYPI